MHISINERVFDIKMSLKVYFIFEQIAGYAFAFGKISDEYILFYSSLLACKEGFDMPFDDFIEVCDRDPSLFESFKDMYVGYLKVQSQYLDDDIKKKKMKKV